MENKTIIKEPAFLYARSDKHIRPCEASWVMDEKGKKTFLELRTEKNSLVILSRDRNKVEGEADMFFAQDHEKFVKGAMTRDEAVFLKDVVQWSTEYIPSIQPRGNSARIAKETLTAHNYKRRFSKLESVRLMNQPQTK